MAEPLPVTPMEEPLAELERRLLNDYVRGAGESLESLHNRSDDAARKLLTEASVYVAARLAEVECRSHYVRALHGQE